MGLCVNRIDIDLPWWLRNQVTAHTALILRPIPIQRADNSFAISNLARNLLKRLVHKLVTGRYVGLVKSAPLIR